MVITILLYTRYIYLQKLQDSLCGHLHFSDITWCCPLAGSLFTLTPPDSADEAIYLILSLANDSSVFLM